MYIVKLIHVYSTHLSICYKINQYDSPNLARLQTIIWKNKSVINDAKVPCVNCKNDEPNKKCQESLYSKVNRV